MSFGAHIRPVIDRVYVSVRAASRDRVRELYSQFGFKPGFESSFYFGLLARPMPADSFAAATTYSGSDMTAELAQGIATVDGEGTWRLTDLGREVAQAVQRTIGAGAEELWSRTPIDTMPGMAVVPRLTELVGTLLEHGVCSAGPAFGAMAPVYEPPDASPAVRLTTRLGALRHYRADAHRAAWQAAGLTATEIRTMPLGPERAAIEAETNRRDDPIYGALSADERLELLAGLGALTG